MSLAERWEGTLSQLRAAGRFRELRPPAGTDFASNDYLGYAGRRAGLVPPTTLSTSGAASRLLRGHHLIWEDVEAGLARWHGAESALVFSSGYVANEGLMSTVVGPRDWVATDRLNHACIGDGLRLAGAKPFKFRHNDLTHLEEGLRSAVGEERFVVTESLFSMDGDRAPLAGMIELCERHGAHLIVDCAHSTGCFASPPATGRGPLLATIHTGGKALGVPGAYVVGSKLLKDLLVNRCRHFLFTTALPPAVGAWWSAMLRRVPGDDEGRDLLGVNSARFRDHLENAGIATLGDRYIVPIVLGDDATAVTAADRLQARGFDVRAVRPPTVQEGTARLRVSIHADHTFEEIDALADALREVLT